MSLWPFTLTNWAQLLLYWCLKMLCRFWQGGLSLLCGFTCPILTLIWSQVCILSTSMICDWTMLLFVIKMSKWIKKLKITKILPRLAKIWTNQFQQKTFHIIDAACENEFLIGQTFGKLRLNLSRNHFLSQ